MRESLRDRWFVRDLEAWEYLETFLVAAVAAILAIRLFLELTGYPKLGGGGLHIAHMLWGGLLMLLALIVLLTFLTKAARHLAAVLGGFGFGTFIDEIGKFVTEDNDYFYRPAVALMYVTFILTFLLIHLLHTRWKHSDTEYLMNALQEVEGMALHALDRDSRDRMLLYLSKSSPEHPLVPVLYRLASEVSVIPPRPPGPLTRFKLLLERGYRRAAAVRGFPALVTGFFLLQAAVTVGYVAALILMPEWRARRPAEALTFVGLAQLGSSALAAGFTLWGVARLRFSRLAAFEMFERAILVSIFLTQVFSFYRDQFSALLGLAANVLILAAVRYVKEQETLRATAP